MTDPKRVLEQIWKETLQLEEVPPDEEFFALGGDSMKMMQIMTRVKEELGVELDQALLFELPTLRQLGEQLCVLLGAGREAASVTSSAAACA